MKTFNVEGGDVCYEEHGTGVPVVLTAGGMAPMTTMRPLADKLKDRYRVILWDRANTGLAQVVIKGPSDVEIWGKQLSGLIRQLGIAPAYLVSCSGGARASLNCAAHFPQDVRGLFLWQLSAGEKAEWVGNFFYGQYAELALKEGMEAIIKTPAYAERVNANPSNRERLLKMDPKEFARVMRDWQKATRPGDPIYCVTEAEARSIKAPTHIVGGVNDAHPRDRSQLMAKLIPGAKFIEPVYTQKDWEQTRDNDKDPMYSLLPGVYEQLQAFLKEAEAARKPS